MARYTTYIVLFPVAVLLGVMLGLVNLGGCSDATGEPGDNDICGPCDDGYVCDVDSGKCVPATENGPGNGNGPDPDLPCGSDFDDCEDGMVCDLETGECVPGVECEQRPGLPSNNDCHFPEIGAGCGGSSVDDCVCDPRDNTCKRRREVCEPCTHDEECGPHDHFSRPAYCVEYGGNNVCLQRATAMGCEPGYSIQGDYCAPTGGSCTEVFACSSDADCPENRPVCNVVSGACIAGCSYDFREGYSRGCSPEEICHQDGRCRAPCETDDDCKEIDESFICFDEPESGKRCRVPGCLHDLECPVPDEGPYLGFCDLRDNECYDDRCMPTTFEGTPHEDPNRHCIDGWACRDDKEPGYCEQMGCIERSSPTIACGIHQFCCLFCRNVTDNPERDECDPTPCPPDREEAPEPAVEGCYMADKATWCASCGDDADCASIQNPKEDPRDENRCNEDVCQLTCETEMDCPTTRWQCSYLMLGCQDHGDCDGGQCLPVDEDDPDSPRACFCDQDGVPVDGLCPPDFRCARAMGEHMCVFGRYCMEQLADEDDPGYCSAGGAPAP